MDHGSLLEGVAWCLAGLWVLRAAGVRAGLRRMRPPRAVPGEPPSATLVSVIVPCRNERERIVETATAHLATRHPNVEVIVVDDGSTDGSAEALEDLARADGRLRVLRAPGPPPGWLGKCHALHVGAAAARGPWLLLSDADVRHAPGLLPRALACVERERLDLLSLLPRNETPSPLVRALFAQVVGQGILAMGLWARTRRGDGLVAGGAGAFILARRSTYEALDGHAAIRDAVVDDVVLARHIRAGGGRTALRLDPDALTVPYARSYREFLRVTEKNAFAVVGWRWSLLAALFAVTLIADVAAPLLVLLHLGLWPATLVVQGSVAAAWWPLARRLGAPRAGFLIWPLLSLLGFFALLASAVAFVRHGGIRWRGRIIPAAALRGRPARARD